MDELTFTLTILCPTVVISCAIMVISLWIESRRKGPKEPIPDKEAWTICFILVFIVVPIVNILLSIYFFYKVVNDEYSL